MMSLPSVNPTKTKAWKELQLHFSQMQPLDLKKLFAQQPDRATQFSISWQDFYLDFSKHNITDKTFALLQDLAEQCQLKTAIASYFSGQKINHIEDRAVLHTALRANTATNIHVDGIAIDKQISSVKKQIQRFTDGIISGTIKGHTGLAFTDVVNIGIGGSDLGPAMVTQALSFYKNHLNTHFISNVDGDPVLDVLKKLNPETTLFVIVSKTFTTQETLTNATTIKKWFVEHMGQDAVATHFVAVSTNLEKIADFGIASENVFPMWDWVGGRFSLWSAVGLSIALQFGYTHFDSLLQGAAKMDQHFKDTALDKNIPVILALLRIWYTNFHDTQSHAVIAYTQYLDKLAPYLQQSMMESNGKGVDRQANPITYNTESVIWGEPGTNSQHAFFQLLHQGTFLIPADFIGFKESLHGNKEHHDKLMANFFAQTQALLEGKDKATVVEELQAKGFDASKIDKLAPFKVFTGNKPTTTILIEKLTPESLGSLIAMYEHQIFVQGVIWNIYSYDQWGVELGKDLATSILKDLHTGKISNFDASTKKLIQKYKAV